MTIFDMAKDLTPVANAAIVDRYTWDAIKEAAKPADPEWPIDTLAGIRIEVIDDPLERKVRAWSLAVTTGHPVMFEGEDREMFVVDPPIVPDESLPAALRF